MRHRQLRTRIIAYSSTAQPVNITNTRSIKRPSAITKSTPESTEISASVLHGTCTSSHSMTSVATLRLSTSPALRYPTANQDGTTPLALDGVAMLCSTCTRVLRDRKGLVSNDLGDDGDRRILFAHHPTSSSLERAAAECCHICRPFWDQIADPERVLLRQVESERPTKSDADTIDLDDYLTICMLQSTGGTRIYGGGFPFSVAFSSGYIDFKRVSLKEDNLALGIHVLLPRLGMAAHRRLA
jgi:hypothetical protein